VGLGAHRAAGAEGEYGLSAALTACWLWIVSHQADMTEIWDARGLIALVIIPWMAERIPDVDGSKDDSTTGRGLDSTVRN